MTDHELGKLARTLAQHAETIAARCRAIDAAIETSHVFGVPVGRDKLDRSLRDVETRVLMAAKLIGVSP